LGYIIWSVQTAAAIRAVFVYVLKLPRRQYSVTPSEEDRGVKMFRYHTVDGERVSPSDAGTSEHFDVALCGSLPEKSLLKAVFNRRYKNKHPS